MRTIDRAALCFVAAMLSCAAAAAQNGASEPAKKPDPGAPAAPAAPAAPTAVGPSRETQKLFETSETRISKIRTELGISLFIASIDPSFEVTDPSSLPGTDIDGDMLGLSGPAIDFEIRPSIFYQIGRDEIGFGLGMMTFPSKKGDETLTEDIRIGDQDFTVAGDVSIDTKISYSQLTLDLSYRMIMPKGRVQFGLCALMFDLETVVRSNVKRVTTQIGGLEFGQLVPGFSVVGDYDLPGMPGNYWKIEGRILMAFGDTSAINAELGINYRYSQKFNAGFSYRLLNVEHDGKTETNDFDASMTMLQHGPQFKINVGF